MFAVLTFACSSRAVGEFANRRFTARLALDGSLASYEIAGCAFVGCRAAREDGGALFLRSAAASVSAARSGFSGCAAAAGCGGAVYAACCAFAAASACFAACDAARVPAAYVRAEVRLGLADGHASEARPAAARSGALLCECAAVAAARSNFSGHDFPAGQAVLFVGGASACRFLHFERNRCGAAAGMRLDAHGAFELANFVANDGDAALFDNQCFSLGVAKCCFVRVGFATLVDGHCRFERCSFDTARADVRKRMDPAAEVADCTFEAVVTLACSVQPQQMCWGAAGIPARAAATAAALVGASLVLLGVGACVLYAKACRRPAGDTARLMYV
jgi:hypothetical protein